MTPSPGAIVLGGNFVGLGLARSLGSQGIPVWVYDTDRSKSIARFSRYTKRFVASQEDAHDLLLREARHHGLEGWVVFPANDDYVETVSTNHQSLSAIYRLTTPPIEVTRFALDKRQTYAKARELGIAAPKTWVTSESVEAIENDVEYPVILKPAINHRFFPHTNIKALPVADRSELRSRFAQMRRHIPADEILIQERIPGGGESQFSFCGACQDGRAYATLVARRRRQYPVDFGNNSSFVETTTQAVVERDGRRFLENIGYDGMAEVEFKFDSRDGQYKILDVNTRAWGWHTLGKAVGIDFAHLTWRQKTGHSMLPVRANRDAVWFREITDLLAIAKSANRGAEVARLLKAIALANLTLATLKVSDPVPFLAEFALWAFNGPSRQQKAKSLLAEL